MNWFRQNRLLGSVMAGFALVTLLVLWFLLYESSAAGEEESRLEATVAELTRLRSGTPFPNERNLSRMKEQTAAYRDSLAALERELQTRMFPVAPLLPNEFQAQLRQAVTTVSENARAGRVRLPENFYLGFDEYATSLPNSDAAPRLGRQLAAVEWIVDRLITSHVDSVNSLSRATLPEEKAAPGASPAAGPGSRVGKSGSPAPVVQSYPIDVTFSASPAATRKVLNQIAAASQQFFIIRTLVVKNQAPKGPSRAGAPGAAIPAPTPLAQASPGASPGIAFIVGTEHLDVAARVEIVKFKFPAKEGH